MLKRDLVKWIVLLLMVSAVPLAYSMFMGLWSYMSISVIGHLESPTRDAVISLIVLGNTLGVVVAGAIISIPLNMFFRKKGYLAVFAVAISIVAWSMAGFIMYGQRMPDKITVFEWFTVICLIPLVGYLIQKYFPIVDETKNA